MKFEKFVYKGRGGAYDGLHLSTKQLTFTLSIYRRLKAERFEISYDTKNKAIAIKPVTEGGFKMAWQVGIKHLHSHMPVGRYLFKEISDDGYIFVYQS